MVHPFRFKAMGGPAELHISAGSPSEANAVFDRCFSEVNRLEDKYSRFRSESLVSSINRGEQNGKPLDEETTGLLNFAQTLFDQSEGLFDLTIGGLRSVWNFHGTCLPTEAELHRALENIGWQKVHWDGSSLNLSHGVEIDFGGLVKEFAVDRVVNLLNADGIGGLVNLSGDIGVSAEGNRSWPIRVRHPRSDQPLASIELQSGALAGSGDYERYIEVKGKRYCHILRPDTGMPAEQGLMAVSVQADQCLLAGAASTVAMLLGKDGLTWLESLGLPFIAVDNKLNVFGEVVA